MFKLKNILKQIYDNQYWTFIFRFLYNLKLLKHKWETVQFVLGNCTFRSWETQQIYPGKLQPKCDRCILKDHQTYIKMKTSLFLNR